MTSPESAAANAHIRDHFDAVAPDYDRWKERARYYYSTLERVLRERIPPGRSVLDAGCGTGTLLSRLEPSRGLGLDLSPRMVEIARRKHPGLEFRAEDLTRPRGGERFDAVVLVDVIEHLPDADAAMEGLRAYGDDDTLYVMTSANPLWEPALHLAESLGLKMPEGDHRWLSRREIRALLRRHGFRIVREEGRMLVPKNVPLLAPLANSLAERAALLRPLCLIQVVEFRREPSGGAGAP